MRAVLWRPAVEQDEEHVAEVVEFAKALGPARLRVALEYLRFLNWEQDSEDGGDEAPDAWVAGSAAEGDGVSTVVKAWPMSPESADVIVEEITALTQTLGPTHLQAVWEFLLFMAEEEEDEHWRPSEATAAELGAHGLRGTEGTRTLEEALRELSDCSEQAGRPSQEDPHD